MPEDRRIAELLKRITDLETRTERMESSQAVVTRGLILFYGVMTTDLILADNKWGDVQVQQYLGNGTWVDQAGWKLKDVAPVARKSGYKISSGKFVRVSMEPVSGRYLVDLVYGCYDPTWSPS